MVRRYSRMMDSSRCLFGLLSGVKRWGSSARQPVSEEFRRKSTGLAPLSSALERALGLGVGAALLFGEEETGCQPSAGLACIQVQVRP